MRIVQINGGAKGSTGKIMMGIAEVARAQGHLGDAHRLSLQRTVMRGRIAGIIESEPSIVVV